MSKIMIVSVMLMAALSRPAGAVGLQIESFLVTAISQVQGAPVGAGWTLLPPPISRSSDQPYALPYTLLANDFGLGWDSGFAFSLQDKGGYFSNRAFVSNSNFGTNLGLIAEASTSYRIVVSTDQVNTPLILNFNFLGSTAGGSARYASGEMNSRAYAGIYAKRVGSPNPGLIESDPASMMWSVLDEVRLNSGQFDRFVQSTNTYDRYSIGLPDTHFSVEYENFISSADLTRDPFTGTLDFGPLQPGEYFALTYTGGASVYSVINYPGSGYATVVDPFSLAQLPPPSLALQGLVLPTAPVPEPPGSLLLLAGVALLVLLAKLRALLWGRR